MVRLLLALGVCGVLVSCSKDVVDEEAEAVVEVKKEEEVMILVPEVWRRTGTFFKAYLGEMELGWEKDQILEYAGEPDGTLDGDWVYRWQETPGRGGKYRQFVLSFDGERLISKDDVGGFLPRRY